MRKKKKKRSLPGRVLRGLLLIVLTAMVFTTVAGYLPFARTPALEDDSEIEARAEAMQRDVATADRAAILESSAAALDERIRMMARAEREIIITTYECHDGESTRDLMAVACHMARQGVRVRFLADGIAGRMDIMPNALFRAVVQCPNVEIRFYNLLSPWTPWRHMGRMHDKYVIADDFAYLLGGRNMYDGFLGNYPTHRHYSQDREALVYNGAQGTPESGGSSLFALKDYFEAIWSLPDTSVYAPDAPKTEELEADLEALEARFQKIRAEKPELFEDADYPAMTLPTDGIWLVSNPTTIYAKQPVVFAQLCALMNRAKEDVVIHSPYAVLNGVMRDALADIAARVPVTLMVNAVENGANVVGSSDYLYHKRDVLSTGVRLLEYAGGISYHGKSVAIDDDLSVIGSYNLDLRSTYVDTELMLVIRGEAVNAQLRAHMEALHADCLRVIDAEHSEAPAGLNVEALSAGKRIALRVLGALLQPFRNLV